MGPVQTPSPERTRPFDEMVAHVDEFDPLPCQPVPLESDPPDGENSELGEMIMTGLVSPV
ncbi:MAG TPA: hypothetical protein VGY32_12155 [Solirubrobacteraceae bacterium]|nr:hypothetical protein [Solirubrobacteraceae bacterium]